MRWVNGMWSVRKTLLVMALSIFAGAIVGVALRAQEKKPDPPAAIEAVKKPTEQWLKDYEEFLALQRAIANLKAKYGIDKLEAELNTQGTALLSQIPAGYQFDQAKKQFVAAAKAEDPKAAKK